MRIHMWLVSLGMVLGLVGLGGLLATASAQAAPPGAVTSLVHGRVLWKGTEQMVAGVSVEVADQKSGLVVMATTTDATGWYTLTVGAGTWLLNVPQTQRYYGYAQEATILPHQEYVLDFFIEVRPPDAPTPIPATATPGPVDASTGGMEPSAGPGSGPAVLPANGYSEGLIAAWLAIGGMGILLVLSGWALRRRSLLREV